VKVIHDQNDARLEQERQKGRDQIRAILTPKQKPKFEEFLRKHDEEKKRNPAEVTRCGLIACTRPYRPR